MLQPLIVATVSEWPTVGIRDGIHNADRQQSQDPARVSTPLPKLNAGSTLSRGICPELDSPFNVSL